MTLGLPNFLEARISPEPNSGCWLWTGRLSSRGYALTRVGTKTVRAHRVIYELFKGPIPKGLEPDHTCKLKGCVNPEHLEPVTHQINVQRGQLGATTKARCVAITHCPRGHEYTTANTSIIMNRGYACRNCKTCGRLKKRGNK